MIRRSLSLLALTAFISAAAATQALACCGCAYTCAPPAPVQIWGLSPSYVVNQGPVYTGPGIYTSPTYEAEVSTLDYPYVGYGDYRRHDYPYDGGPYGDPFRHRVYHRHWEGAVPGYWEGTERPHHFGMFHRHETEVFYRHGFGRHAITMSGDEHWVARDRRDMRDLRGPRVRQY
jgi:hypothetical protein